MDSIKGLRRTHYCGEFGVTNIGENVIAGGFAARVRDKGGIIFIDLRDNTGIVQLVFDDTTEKSLFEKAKTVRSEYNLMARGILRERESVNKDIKTGGVEILVTELRILSKAITPPFELLDNIKTDENTRLKYRYLDLRRLPLQRNLLARHNIARLAREYFYSHNFIEIETPTFIKSTPEGARDYLVPSRVHEGKFYALPQSPQIYKQLLMIAGFDRYIQFARCYRDEDLRADRQPEFTQIDVEMAYVDVDDILSMVEGVAAHVTKGLLDIDVPLPLPRLSFVDAMERYGSDKPDTRYGMEIINATDFVQGISFPPFADAIAKGGSVRVLIAEKSAAVFTRKEIDKCVEFVKGIGAGGLPYIRWAEDSDLPASSFGKFLEGNQLSVLAESIGLKKGGTAFFSAGITRPALQILGSLRVKIAKQLDIVPAGQFNYLWVTDMPFFEQNAETGAWEAAHHPFTMPLDECVQYLDSAPEKVFAKAYDLVLNGTELCSGSIRITNPELQQRMFRLLGLTTEEIAEKFGFLVDAYQYGAPPHGGVGIGLDRLAMVLCGAESLRDVTAFPKTKDAAEPMSECPATVSGEQLAELHIRTIK